MGWPEIAGVFDQYQGLLEEYVDVQREAVAGFEMTNAAMDHYFTAYELWLDATSQAFTLGTPSKADTRQATQSTARTPRAHQRSQSAEKRERRATTIAAAPSPSNQSQGGQDQTTADDALRQRVTRLEHRQKALEETLEEIHAEVVP